MMNENIRADALELLYKYAQIALSNGAEPEAIEWQVKRAIKTYEDKIKHIESGAYKNDKQS